MTTNSDCRRSSKEGVRIIVDREARQSRRRGRRGRGVEGGGGRRHHKEGNDGDVTGCGHNCFPQLTFSFFM
jgi:hypothetical protein